MMSQRPEQKSLFPGDTQYLDFVGRENSYGFLAQHRPEPFRDEDFAELYGPEDGRPSVSPSSLGLALVLQTHDRVSDAEATARAQAIFRRSLEYGRHTGYLQSRKLRVMLERTVISGVSSAIHTLCA